MSTTEELSPFDPVLSRRLPVLAGIGSLAMPGDDLGDDAGEDLFMAAVEGYVAPQVDVTDQSVAGPHGPIAVRVYRPRDAPAPSAGVVWIHGGAFVWGDLDMAEADVVSRELCARGNLLVVSVDYALSRGGVRFPVPHDEVYAAWTWALDTPSLLPAGSPWVLGGASAGGNLALGAALRARDARSHEPTGLMLCYPIVHERVPAFDDALARGMAQLPPALRFTPEFVRDMNRNYVGDRAPASDYAMPGEASLRDLPPCLVVLAEYDDLRPSGEVVLADMERADVPVVRHLERGVPHGHLNIPGLPAAGTSLKAMVDFVIAQADRTR